MKPLVSIIMGAYNCEDIVSKGIESVISQTYENWEFIICDDCSKDNTLQILTEYSQKDSRIKVLHNEKNLQLAAALNNCLKVAKGKYIARMDADDVCLPERLAKQVEFLENHPEFAVVGSGVKVFDGEKVTSIRIPKEYPTKENVLYSPTFMHPTIMMRKEIYDELNGYTVSNRTIRVEDLDLWYRFYKKGFKGYNLQEPLLLYHETIEDYCKKRTLKLALMRVRTVFYGYRLLNVPLWKYYLILKPIISASIPNKIMIKYHQHKEKRAKGK